MSSETTCGECGKVIPAGSPGGYCGRCLLGLGLDEEPASAAQRLSVGHHKSQESVAVQGQTEEITMKVESTEPTIEAVGQSIGRYKILEKVGEGGCGVVYVADQTEPVRRRVALKVIKLGMDTKSVVLRFEAERQALAMMDHPNIAKVLDAGSTEQGRPFFVMELVRGIKITDYCDQNKLPTSERLDLFIKVSQAIQHAHQKGIIHRDIKPSNILVTLHDGFPVPKVIDFGIAKATEGRLTDATVYTQLHQFIGTPAYMSPEQAEMSALDVDTRSDIYSLGVLLYELLTGQTPFDPHELMSQGIDAMRRTIREKDPPKPSTKLATLKGEELTTTAKRRGSEAPRLIHLLRGDLDWIVMKCLEKDRTRRYDTANGLARDVERHLRNEPVVARPRSRLYEFQKAIKRHRLGFAATTTVLLSLAVGVGVSRWQAVKATRAEAKAREQAELARQESEKARSVKDFLVEQVLGVNPYMEGVSDPSRRVLVEKVERAIGEQFTNQPQVEADLRFALATAFSGIGDPIGHLRQVERAYELRRRVFGLTNSDTLHALSAVAALCFDVGRGEEGETLFREGLAVIRASPHQLSQGEAHLLCEYANQRSIDGHPAEALALMQEAMPVLRRTADPKSWRFQTKLAWLPLITGDAGRTEEAEAMFNEQIRERERIYGPEHPMTAQVLSLQAIFFAKHGRLNEAVGSYERAIPVYYRSIGTNHWMTCWTEMDLAQVYERQGRLDAAAKLYRSAYPRLANNTNYLLKPFNRGRCLDIAYFFVNNRDAADAKAVLGPLSRFFEQNPPKKVNELEEFGRTEFLMGRIIEEEGRLKEAITRYKRAAEAGYGTRELAERYILGNGVPRNRTEAAKWYRKGAEKDRWSQVNLGLLYAYGIGLPRDQAEALNWLGKALVQWHKDAEQGTVEGLNGLAWFLATCPVAELRDGSNAVRLAEALVAKTSRKNAGFLDTLAAAYAEIGDFSKAVSVQEEAKALNTDVGVAGAIAGHLNLYKLGSPLRLDILDLETGTELSIAEVVRNKGWRAAAEFCRNHFDSFNQPTEWRAKALVFAYAGDNEWCRKTAGRVIRLAQSVTNWEEQLVVLHAATRAPVELTAAEREACEALVEKVEVALSTSAPIPELRCRRAIGAMMLRLGRASEGLTQFETVLQKLQPPLHRGITVLFKSLCLEDLRRETEAREAFEEGRRIVETIIPGPLAETEWPLSQDQLISLILLREARARIVPAAK